MHIPTNSVFQFYRYEPSLTACIISIALFSITSIIHIYQLLRTRAWSLIPLALGGCSECLGYILRIFSSREAPNYSIGLAIGQGTPTLLAPALIAASIYMCLGRIIRATDGQHLSLIPIAWLTKFFVAGDVLGLIIQGVGATIMPLRTLQNYLTGSRIVMAGLGLLVFSFSLFVLVAISYDYRLRHHPTPLSATTSLNWKRELQVLYASSALIFIRSVYRLVEYAQGNSGWLNRHELTYYMFDALLMWFALMLFNWRHPSRVEAVLKGGRYCDGVFGIKALETKENGEEMTRLESSA
ncbi:Uncharacterized protein BP5553_02194 [Venustampulla echinocandica]|uniref:RTA1-domain-containing protein n=1 Tax=Venustampulla echinocandica TaxID=2656787 RepID=A0A370U375_9HELO|nr:Uncharacterized protein BP5553_02194 [Venustampulla echinocandica]RDL42215.1 Uncharacterized protein BP5553_02194 [Venustampulla echinocandica]